MVQQKKNLKIHHTWIKYLRIKIKWQKTVHLSTVAQSKCTSCTNVTLPILPKTRSSYSSECLLSSSRRTSRSHLQHVKPHCLWQRPALANDDIISLLHTEAWWHMSRNVGMPLLISLVFLNIMKIITSNNYSPRHLGTVASTGENATPDGDIAGERAFLINISSYSCRQATLFSHKINTKVDIPSHLTIRFTEQLQTRLCLPLHSNHRTLKLYTWNANKEHSIPE